MLNAHDNKIAFTIRWSDKQARLVHGTGRLCLSFGCADLKWILLLASFLLEKLLLLFVFHIKT